MDHWTLHWLDAAGDLRSCKDRIGWQVEQACAAMATFVRLQPLDILVQRGSEGIFPEIGLAGRAVRSSMVTLTIDPYNDNLEKTLADGAMQRQMVREAHLAMRMAGPGYGFMLGGALVSEGLAGQFVRLVFASRPEPWERAVADAELSRYWPDQSELVNPKYDHGAWFGGSGDKPRWHAGSVIR